MKKNWIAIPQNKRVEYDYQNGWEIEDETIKKENLKLDEFFDLYVKDSSKTKCIGLSDKEYYELDKLGIWDNLNNISPNALIDHHEEAEITNPEELEDVIIFLRKNIDLFSKESNKVILELIDLIEEALSIGVGVYFFF